MFFSVQIEFGLDHFSTVHQCASYQYALKRAQEELQNPPVIVRVKGADGHVYYEDHNFVVND